ncbi:MAG TPA: hypothetical protein VGV69_09050 [Solirubrobacterales bacterium]|nr:hypothetical protein [Solirubrobacterales bacterium]
MQTMRESWTDERLDDLKENVNERFNRVDKRFDRVDADIRELRQTMVQGFFALVGVMLAGFLSLAGLIVF